MIKSYDRKELVARFGPRPFCASVDDGFRKPPTPPLSDSLEDGGLAIKPSNFNSLYEWKTTKTTHTTKFEQGDQRRLSDGFPDEWQAIFDELKGSTPLDGFGDARWQSLVDDTGVFLVRWGEAANLLSWTALDLFGVHPTAPAVRFDVMGLLPVLRGDSVVALTKDEARIRGPSRAILTFRRVAQAGAVLVTRCLQ
jgi:hypothetical protein